MIPSWFSAARFGLFMHFGLYSAAARGEWVQSYEKIPAGDYRQHFDFFAPDLFDAPAIARTAKEAGMGYAVLTAKHHDGFALWDTEHSDFTSVVACGRDLVQEFITALREQGLRVGLYFSLIDWHDENFTIDGFHPDRDSRTELNTGRDMSRYRELLFGQVEELLTNYGDIDYMFFDFTYPQIDGGEPGKSTEDWNSAAILELCRTRQPRMVINDRLGLPGDFVTPEQYQPSAPLRTDGELVPWEACQTLNGSWGYARDNQDYKSAELLVRMLIDSVSMNGNLLLNVGPDGRGAIAPQEAALLKEIGEWMRLHQGSILSAGPAPFPAPSGTAYTQRGHQLYLHLFSWPFRHVHLPELAGRVRYVRFLHDGSWLRTSVSDPSTQASHLTPAGEAEGTLTVHLPTQRPDVLVPVIEITLREDGWTSFSPG